MRGPSYGGVRGRSATQEMPKGVASLWKMKETSAHHCRASEMSTKSSLSPDVLCFWAAATARLALLLRSTNLVKITTVRSKRATFDSRACILALASWLLLSWSSVSFGSSTARVTASEVLPRRQGLVGDGEANAVMGRDEGLSSALDARLCVFSPPCLRESLESLSRLLQSSSSPPSEGRQHRGQRRCMGSQYTVCSLSLKRSDALISDRALKSLLWWRIVGSIAASASSAARNAPSWIGVGILPFTR